MKRYISAILIPCFLLQLFGCYTTKEISLDELNDKDEAIITVSDSLKTSKYILKKNLSMWKLFQNPDVFYSDKWSIKPGTETITLITHIAPTDINGKNSYQFISNIITDTSEIKNSEICSIVVDDFSGGKTFGLIGIILLGIAGIIALSYVALRGAISSSLWK